LAVNVLLSRKTGGVNKCTSVSCCDKTVILLQLWMETVNRQMEQTAANGLFADTIVYKLLSITL